MNSKKVLYEVLPAPTIPNHLSKNAKWLSGEGCGSWFVINKIEEGYLISRYSPEGRKECEGIFALSNQIEFDLKVNYELTYMSHCAEVNVIQKNLKYTFNLINKNRVSENLKDYNPFLQ